MQVSLNGKGTSVFDPRPAVYEFLKRKDRRNRIPNEPRTQGSLCVAHKENPGYEVGTKRGTLSESGFYQEFFYA